jgi:hypothetical protein
MSANPAANNVANNLLAQIVHYDAAFIPPLMANTAAFVWAAEQREQALHTGVNRTMFTYDLITDTIPASADGVIGSPEYFGQTFVNAQVAEYNAFANWSAFSAAASLDPNQAKSTAELLAYQLGITINNLAYTGLDAQANTDTTVNQNALISGGAPAYLLTINALRTMKNQLFNLPAMPIKGDDYGGQIHPLLLNDISNAVTVNASIADLWKYSEIGRYEEVAGVTNQWKRMEIGPGLGVSFGITPFVTSTASLSGGKTGYRTYIEGKYGFLMLVMRVPGDTEFGEADWKMIKTNIVTDAPSSSYDPTATIGAWVATRAHLVFTPPPFVQGTARIRWIDAVPQLTS